jgi:hypothetical protein
VRVNVLLEEVRNVVKFLKFSRVCSVQRYPTMSGNVYDEKVAS